MFKVLKYRGDNEEEFRTVCTCEDLNDARIIEFSLDYAIKHAGGSSGHFAVLDVEQHTIVHRTKPSLAN